MEHLLEHFSALCSTGSKARFECSLNVDVNVNGGKVNMCLEVAGVDAVAPMNDVWDGSMG